MATTKKYKRKVPKHIITLTFLTRMSLNKLDALRLYGDTCLNSTVSHLIHKHGFAFIKKTEPHQNKAGGRVYFTRYWLVGDNMDKASQLIDRYYPDNTLGNGENNG